MTTVVSFSNLTQFSYPAKSTKDAPSTVSSAIRGWGDKKIYKFKMRHDKRDARYVFEGSECVEGNDFVFFGWRTFGLYIWMVIR